MDLPILSYFSYNNELVNTCNFIPGRDNTGSIYYEVVRVIEGIPLFLNDHINRLYSSISLAGKNISENTETLLNRIVRIIEANNLSSGNIRFQIRFIDEKKYDFICMAIPFFYPSIDMVKKGVPVSTIDINRDNPHQKLINFNLRKFIEKTKLENEAFELIHTNDSGQLTEGSKSNIFFVRKSLLFTPPTKRVLPGITRQKIFDVAQKLDINIKEKDIDVHSIGKYDGAFLTATSLKVLPIYKFNQSSFDPQNNQIIRLINGYNKLIDEHINMFKRS